MNTSIHQHIVTTPLTALRPVFGTGAGEGIRRFNLFRTLLARHTLYAVWAEPILDGTTIRWQTELAGEIQPYESLPPDGQDKARRVLRYYVDAIYRLIDHHRERDDLRAILDDCFEIPRLNNLYLVGRRPVLVLWGYLYSDVNPPRGLVRKLIRGIELPRLMVNAKVIQAGDQIPIPHADVQLRYEGQNSQLQTNADGNVSFQEIQPFDYPRFQLDATADNYRPATTTLQLDRSVTDLVWSGFTPLITTIALQPAVQEMVFRVQVVDMHTNKPISGATVTLGTERVEQTVITSATGEAVFSTMPVRDDDQVIAYITHPSYADERRELNTDETDVTLQLDSKGLRGKRAAFNVNLRWATIDDLDLLVTDPGGNLVYYGNRTASFNGSTGILDIDANAADATATNEPQENAYWDSPHMGSYRIEVLLYKRRTPADTDIPFEVTIFQNNDRLTLPGHIRTERDRQLITIVDF